MKSKIAIYHIRRLAFTKKGGTWVCFNVTKWFLIKLFELTSCTKISEFNAVSDYDNSSIKGWIIALCINYCDTEF